jgi:hypothetical protein
LVAEILHLMRQIFTVSPSRLWDDVEYTPSSNFLSLFERRVTGVGPLSNQCHNYCPQSTAIYHSIASRRLHKR